MIPIFITVRDLLDAPRQLATQVANMDLGLPILLDLASTYPPTVEWLATADMTTYRLENIGNRAAWNAGLVRTAAEHVALYGSPYFGVSDGDIDLSGIPQSLLEDMAAILDADPTIPKVAVSLRLDDLPDCYQDKARVLAHEGQFWQKPRRVGRFDVFDADADTHFALHRAGSRWEGYKAVRTAAPHIARHTPWYWDPDNLAPDVQWYLNNMVTHWATWSTRMKLHAKKDA